HDRPLSRAEIFALKAPKVPVGFETIDADGHTTTLPDRWYEPYLDKKYWDWVPRVIDGRWMAEGRCIDQPVPLPSMRDGETGALGFPSGWRLKDLREISVDDVRKRGGADPMDRLELMDEDGVDVAYLYPSTMLSAPWALSSSAFAHALCRAHNDWLFDYCQANPHRLRGVPIVTPHDMLLAVEELQRVGKKGAQAIMIRPNTCLGINVDHPNYERFYAVAQDLDIAIGIHEGFQQGSHALQRLGQERTHNWLQLHAFEHPAEHMMAVMLLTTGGVMHRYPKLRF